MRPLFTDYVIYSNELCNHYTGFPSLHVLNAVFEYLDLGINNENVFLYNYQKTRNDSLASGRPIKLNLFESYILTLVCLRQNFDLNHLGFLYRISEGTVLNKHMDKLHVFTFGINLFLAKQRANFKNNAHVSEKKIPE